MLTTFIVYLVILLAVGFVAGKRGKSSQEDFLVSSRDHGSIVGALSASASSESGWVMLGLCGAAYGLGISTLWLLPGCLAGYLFNWLFIAPRLRDISAKTGAVNIGEVIEYKVQGKAAGKAARIIVGFTVLILLSCYASAQFVAMGKTMTSAFGWSYSTGIIVGVLLVIVYTLAGGLRAVSWTDVPQAILMVTALIVVPVIALIKLDSDHSLIAQLTTIDPKLTSFTHGQSGWPLFAFLAGWIGIGLGYPGQPHVLRRFMALKPSAKVNRAALISVLWSQFAFAGAILIGMISRVLYPSMVDAEQALPTLATNLFPAVFSGLVISAIFSAICSTADSQLLEAASSGIGLFKSNKLGTAATSRVFVCILGVIAGGLALLDVKVIFSFILYAWAGLASGIGVVITGILMSKRELPAKAVVAALIVGPMTVVLWKSVFNLSGMLYEIIPGCLASTIILLVASRFGASVTNE